MWSDDDLVLIDFIHPGDIICHEGQYILVDTLDFDEEWKVLGTEQEWEERVEISIPDGSIMSTYKWEQLILDLTSTQTYDRFCLI